jgi:hypothetical protein
VSAELTDVKPAGPEPASVKPVTPAEALNALPPKAAQLAAVEILLAEPEALADDVLESSLYIYRERLRAS